MGEVTLRAKGLVKEYTGRRGRPPIRAVRDVSLEIEAGWTLGVVGESGCGKSTLARLLVGLEPPTSGSVEIEGEPVRAGSRSERRALANGAGMSITSSRASTAPSGRDSRMSQASTSLCRQGIKIRLARQQNHAHLQDFQAL